MRAHAYCANITDPANGMSAKNGFENLSKNVYARI